MQDLSSNLQIDQIEIIELLGRGGMSSVYKARQPALDRIVALKILSAEAGLDEDDLKRFQQEARITSTLNHPNIAKTFSFGIAKTGQPYLVMEYLQGRTLHNLFDTEGILRLEKFRDIFLPVLSALALAHEAGLVHRDIKPGNIMICHADDGAECIKLLDFSIAKAIDSAAAGQQALTKTGALLGSPSFMSPEQCAGKKLDGRSDIYSLSCVMYEALCGKPPFTGASAIEVMHNHLHDAPPAVSDVCREIDVRPELVSLVLWGLCKDPAERPQKAAELSERLRSVLNDITLNKAPRLKKNNSTGLSKRLPALLLVAVPVLLVSGFFALERVGTKKRPVEESFQGISASSLPTLTAKALKFDKAGNFSEAIKYYDQAIRLVESSRLNRNDELLNLITDVLECHEEWFSKLSAAGLKITDPVVHAEIEDEYAHAIKGMKICLEMPISNSAAQLSYGRFAKPAILTLERQGRINDACAKNLEMLKMAESKWGAASMAAFLLRESAVRFFFKAERLKEAEALAIRSINQSATEMDVDQDGRSTKMRIRGVLAQILKSEGKFKESERIINELRHTLIQERNNLSVGVQYDLIAMLINNSKTPEELEKLESLISETIKMNPRAWQEDVLRKKEVYSALNDRYGVFPGQKMAQIRSLKLALSFGNDGSAPVNRLNAGLLGKLIRLLQSTGENSDAAFYKKELYALEHGAK